MLDHFIRFVIAAALLTLCISEGRKAKRQAAIEDYVTLRALRASWRFRKALLGEHAAGPEPTLADLKKL